MAVLLGRHLSEERVDVRDLITGEPINLVDTFDQAQVAAAARVAGR